MTEINKKINDFHDKFLLIVDNDSPFRDRLVHAMEKKDLKLHKPKV